MPWQRRLGVRMRAPSARQRMLPFLERTTRREWLFNRVILGATLVVLAGYDRGTQSARYRPAAGAIQIRDALVRKLFGRNPTVAKSR